MTVKVRIEESADGAPHNVVVTTSDCAVTALFLEARARAPLANRPIYDLPIRTEDTTRFYLEPGEYVFIPTFKNDDAKSALKILVETDAQPPMEPEGPLPMSAEQHQTGSLAFLVTVQ